MYDRLTQECHYKYPITDQVMGRRESNDSLVTITNKNRFLFDGRTSPFKLSVYNASLSIYDHDRGSVRLKTTDDLRNCLGDRYTLFSAELVDVKVMSIHGPHQTFSAWVVEPFRFLPQDAGDLDLTNDGDEWSAPSVFAPNLPSEGRPMRIEISVYFKSEEWIIDGL